MRPRTLLSCAVSLDGCLDDASGERLVLSGPEDLDRVDAERARCDAVLVGAGTVRRDDPRLAIRSAARIAERTAAGLAPHPLRVVLAGRAGIRADARLFAAAGGPVLVYCPDGAVQAVRTALPAQAEVCAAGPGPYADPAAVLDDLAARGAARVMVEGGSAVLSSFLAAGLVDELQLAIAPFFVGQPDAPRFAAGGPFPFDPAHPLVPAGARQVGDVVVLTFLSPGDGGPS